MEFTDDPHPDSPVEWEHNWLSDSMAKASQTLTPHWCQTPEHFTSRLTQYIWTDCPCCLAIRGFVLGVAASVTLVFLVALILAGR